MKKEITESEFLKGIVTLSVITITQAILEYFGINEEKTMSNDAFREHVWKRLAEKGIEFKS